MKPPAKNYVSSRVLKLNIGFLLSAGPGNIHETSFDVPAVRVADDLYLTYVKGPLRLSRTKEGILIQGELLVGITAECYRCLDPAPSDFAISLEELYAYQSAEVAEFIVHDDGVLDIAPLLRAECMIATTRGVLCRPDCKGLCLECGTNLNHGVCQCGLDDIDPRLAQLKQLLGRN